MTKVVINPTLNSRLTIKKKRAPILRPYYRPFFYVAVPLSLLSVVFAVFFYQYLPPVVPLFNTMLVVSDRLVNKEVVFLLPGLAVTINVVHALVIFFGRRYELIILQVFSYFTIFVQGLILAVLVRLIWVII